MDLKQYIAIEEGLAAKLSKTWRIEATKLYAKMLAKVSAGDFNGARNLVQEIDLTEVGTKNEATIRSFLRASAMFGAKLISGKKKPVMSVGQYKQTMDRVVSVFLATMEWNATDYTMKAALQSIARAEKEAIKDGVVQKAEGKKRFVKEFVSFQKNGDDMIKLVSALHTSRMATWGFTAEAEVTGVTQYQLQAVMDGRTSEFCRLINGKVFLVEDARSTVVQVLNLDNPDDAKQVTPWPKTSKAALASYGKMSSAELTNLNLHIPPFHPGCRTLCVPVGSYVPAKKKPATWVDLLDTREGKALFHETGPLLPALSGTNQNLLLKEVLSIYDMTGLPKVASKKVVSDLVEKNNIELFRGVSGNTSASAKELLTQYAEGEYFVGRGVFGDGTYYAMRMKGIEDPLNVSRHYADGTEGSIARATLAEGAKVGDYQELLKQARIDSEAQYKMLEQRKAQVTAEVKAAGLPFDEAMEKIDAVNAQMRSFVDLTSDIAVYAVINGYDAYIVRETGYMVVLNRSKVVMEELGGYP